MPPKPWHELIKQINANYRFIPFDPEPAPAPVQPAATRGVGTPQDAGAFHPLDLDKPLPGAVSGTITMDWIARTPVLFGQQRVVKKKSGGAAFTVTEPQRLHAGEGAPHIISGRALKGMVRQVLRIATKGRVGKFGNQHPAWRDPNYQAKKVEGRDLKSGWLTIDSNGLPVIHPVISKLIEYDISQMIIGKTLAKIHSKVVFKVKPSEHMVYSLEFYNKKGERQFEKPAIDAKAVPVPNPVYQRFLEAYGAYDSQGKLRPKGGLETWVGEYLRIDAVDLQITEAISRRKMIKDAFNYNGKISSHRNDNPPGIPIYFYDDCDGMPTRIGLTQIMPVAADHDVETVLQRAQPDMAMAALDWAEAMLGHVWEEEQEADTKMTRSLKGRVRFGIATCSNSTILPSARGGWYSVTMQQPKPGYFPFYLRKPPNASGRATYDDLDSMAAGRKRYPSWARFSGMDAVSQVSLPELIGMPEAKPQGTDSYLRFLAVKAAFTGQIRFRNLLREELGALLWALSLGDEEAFTEHGGTHCHSAGRGRALSFGSILPANIRLTRLHQQGRQMAGEQAQDTSAEMIGFIEAFGKAVHGADTLSELNAVPRLSRLRLLSNPKRARAFDQALGLAIRQANTNTATPPTVFQIYHGLRLALVGEQKMFKRKVPRGLYKQIPTTASPDEIAAAVTSGDGNLLDSGLPSIGKP